MLFPNNRKDLAEKFVKNATYQRTYADDKSHIIISAPYMVDILTEVMYPNYRYCTDTNVWYHYNGQQFQEFTALSDVLQKSFNQYKTIIEHSEANPLVKVDPMFKDVVALNRLHQSGFLDSVLNKLKGKSQLQVTQDKFDIHDHLLNTPKGLFDLRSGGVMTNSTLNLCKMITQVGPLDDEDGSKCPHYMRHLKFMADGDDEILQYLEELSGYILTGDISQQEFYWWFGRKFNGKSALAKTWQYVLKDYAETGGSGQFARRQNEPHSEEDMRLRGKRFVWIDELTGSQFNQEKIKRWTDGGYVKAAEKGGKTIEFQPKCKLLFTSNNKPTINGADGGFERRLGLTPFLKQIKIEDRIFHYEDRYLYPEAPYILNRMILQAKRYYAAKEQNAPVIIIRPAKTKAESAAYMHDNDIAGEFVKHGCDEDSEYMETAKNIFEACQIFCQENNYDPISAKKLGIELDRHGFKSITNGKVRSWKGLKLNQYYTNKIRVGYG